jgi:hypothetical protein
MAPLDHRRGSMTMRLCSWFRRFKGLFSLGNLAGGARLQACVAGMLRQFAPGFRSMNAPTIAFFLEVAFSPWVSFLGPERLQFASPFHDMRRRARSARTYRSFYL